MSTGNRAVAGHTGGPARLHDSGLWRRLVTPAPRATADVELDPLRVATVAAGPLDDFHDRAELDVLDGAEAQPRRPWVALPVGPDDGTIRGVFAIAPSDAVDAAKVAVAVSVAGHRGGLVSRAEHLRLLFAAREHAEWLARTSELRLIEERRARIAAERSLRALRMASDTTALLLSTFEYRSALRQVARIVATDLSNGCVFDVEEELGVERMAYVPAHPEDVVVTGLSDLVGNVIRYRRAVVTARVSPSVPDGDPRSRVVAAHARRALGVDWIVSVPISTDGNSVLGVLTVFGSAPDYAPLPISVVEELARRAALAIENGRLYVAALETARKREQVLSMVSHDLKNSFCVILMSVARVLEGMPSLEVDRRQRGRSQLELIQRSARRMMKLVADLLDVAAIDAGHVSVTLLPCDVRALVDEVFEELAAQANAAGVELVGDVPRGLPPAQADAHRLTQVLKNLVDNAIKFTAAGGTVTARATADEKTLVVSITDTGVGIPAAHLEHAFDRFWHGPTAKAGSGLGLAICRSLVERSGGRIWAKSTPGVGTTMTFTLPLGAAT